MKADTLFGLPQNFQNLTEAFGDGHLHYYFLRLDTILILFPSYIYIYLHHRPFLTVRTTPSVFKMLCNA